MGERARQTGFGDVGRGEFVVEPRTGLDSGIGVRDGPVALRPEVVGRVLRRGVRFAPEERIGIRKFLLVAQFGVGDIIDAGVEVDRIAGFRIGRCDEFAEFFRGVDLRAVIRDGIEIIVARSAEQQSPDSEQPTDIFYRFHGSQVLEADI